MANLIRKNNSVNRYNDFYDMVDSFFNSSMNTDVFESSFKLDVSEDEDKFLVEAEMPGIEKDSIDIDFDRGQLTLTVNSHTEHSDEKKNYIHKERKSTRMTRSMYFGDIDEENIKAKLDKGILEIEIPKRKEEKTNKKIEIE
ncbi:Hsp20/alpha crystallin family protein [uncultured Anaerococcus sp.]|uniref:Hsp20/alpha crystallin family protein n=1 Tax=uncultured Anaerococcus sp. TaxID=293428 RepID=UPI0025CD52AB|nr:Hsp20/alpha crystallin family protein [uncultured Anaerococcus sp.]